MPFLSGFSVHSDELLGADVTTGERLTPQLREVRARVRVVAENVHHLRLADTCRESVEDPQLRRRGARARLAHRLWLAVAFASLHLVQVPLSPRELRGELCGEIEPEHRHTHARARPLLVHELEPIEQALAKRLSGASVRTVRAGVKNDPRSRRPAALAHELEFGRLVLALVPEPGIELSAEQIAGAAAVAAIAVAMPSVAEHLEARVSSQELPGSANAIVAVIAISLGLAPIADRFRIPLLVAYDDTARAIGTTSPPRRSRSR